MPILVRSLPAGKIMDEAQKLVFVSCKSEGREARRVPIAVNDLHTWDKFVREVRSQLDLRGIQEIRLASTGMRVTSVAELQDIDELCVVGVPSTEAPQRADWASKVFASPFSAVQQQLLQGARSGGVWLDALTRQGDASDGGSGSSRGERGERGGGGGGRRGSERPPERPRSGLANDSPPSPAKRHGSRRDSATDSRRASRRARPGHARVARPAALGFMLAVLVFGAGMIWIMGKAIGAASQRFAHHAPAARASEYDSLPIGVKEGLLSAGLINATDAGMPGKRLLRRAARRLAGAGGRGGGVG
ncbi:MAG: hypothetical protein J3K34DRAFT_71090 [Monoraphidium minutum]|nr:MAG: hypothetical protein J3K34DRAFT_71090 [Monoraphidium minutum]